MSARSFDLKPKSYGNVIVKENKLENNVLSVSVLLHGNEVVKIEPFRIVLNDCTWRTNTTKTAINRALTLLDRSEKISQVRGQWYINGEKFNGHYIINKGV